MSSIDTQNLKEIARGRPSASRRRIREMDQGPPLEIVADRSYYLTPAFIGSTVGKLDPDSISYDQMRQMRRNGVIAFALHSIAAVHLGADHHFEGTDQRQVEFVSRCYERIHSALTTQMLTALPFGFAAITKRFELIEPDWTYTDPDGSEKDVWDAPAGIKALVWDQPRVLPPAGAHPEFTSDGESFDGIRHDSLSPKKTGGGPLEVDAQHSLWFCPARDTEFGSWYGYPRTGYAFPIWWSQTYRNLLWDRSFEQRADPPLVVRVPDGMSPHPETGEMVDNRELGILVGASLRDGATIVMSSDVIIDDVTGKPSGTPSWDVNFLQGGENLAAFSQSAEQLDIRMLRSMFVPDQALVEGHGATMAASSVNVSTFVASQATLAESMDRHINEYMIPDLLDQNFRDPVEVVKVTTGFRPQDLTFIADLLRIIASQDPNALQLDVRKAGEALKVPMLTAEQQQEREANVGPIEGSSGQAQQPPESQGPAPGETGGVGSAPQPAGSVRNTLPEEAR